MSLKDFTNNRMKMSHVYQPVTLKVLLQQNGQATIDEIAKSLLLYDQSQIDYYEPPPVCRRLQSKYGWSLWKKVTEPTDFQLRYAPARFG